MGMREVGFRVSVMHVNAV